MDIFNIWKPQKKEGIYIEKPNPLNLEFRKQISFYKDDFSVNYLNKFKHDMEHRYYDNIIEMNQNDLILFAVRFLSLDKSYQYFYIYENDNIIGEIYTYASGLDGKDYYFDLYLDEKYRTTDNYSKAIIEFEKNMFCFTDTIKKICIDTASNEMFDILSNSDFSLDTEFYDGKRRYICKKYMYEGMTIEIPNLEHEEKYKIFLKNNECITYNILDYKKWLSKITKDKSKTIYFLMYYNDSLKENEIVGVGHILKNWKKLNCISYEIEKKRRQTDFGEYFAEMLLEKLDENAEYIKLACSCKDTKKINNFEKAYGNLITEEYKKNKLVYFEIPLIVY